MINKQTIFRLHFVRLDGAREFLDYGNVEMVRSMSVSSGKSKWVCVMVELIGVGGVR